MKIPIKVYEIVDTKYSLNAICRVLSPEMYLQEVEGQLYLVYWINE